MNSKVVSIQSIKMNPSNPRIIKDHKFTKLVRSIKEFPEMLDLRPIVVNEDMIVLGGNMRLKACMEAGLKEVPIIITSLDENKQSEFIIKDNIGYGEWDWDMLANTWDAQMLDDWGLHVPLIAPDINMDEFFKDQEAKEKQDECKIVLEYTQEEYDHIIEAFGKRSGSRESIVYELLLGKE